MPRFWLGQRVFRDLPVPGWYLPDNCNVSLNLLSTPQRQAGEGTVLFVTPNAVNLGSDYTNLGTDLDAILTGQQKASWRSRFGLPNALAAQTLKDALWETMTIQADPTGEDRCRPIVPTSKGRRWNLWIDGVRLHTQKFDAGRPEWLPVIDQLKRIYRAKRLRSLEVGDTHYRKWLGYQVRKYRRNYREFQPFDVPDEEPLDPETTISDDFNRADNDTLGTGAGGWSWTEVLNDMDIVSNQAKNPSASTARSRAESDLAGDDHYSQATMQNNLDNHGVLARFDSAADSSYAFIGGTVVGCQLGEITTGSYATLLSGGANIAANSVVKLEVDGSDLEGFDDGASARGPHTDASFAGQTRCGIIFHGSGNHTLDDFEAADLGAPPAGLDIPIAAYHYNHHLSSMAG